jgi:hypothetical protein
VSNEKILIEDTDLVSVRNICQYIDNPRLRNRAVANVTGTVLASKYFLDYDVDTNSGLHNICKVLEDIEISDIYVNGNYIDVRLYMHENELSIPSSHFERNLIPIAYMFIKIDSELTDASVQGFLFPTDVNLDFETNGYYKVKEDDLRSFYELEDKICAVDNENISSETEIKIFDYLDNKLDNIDEFYRTMLKSKEARLKLKDAANAQIIFNFISNMKRNELDIENLEYSPNTEFEDDLQYNHPIDFDDDSVELLDELNDDINQIDDFDANSGFIEDAEFDETTDQLGENDVVEYLQDEQSLNTIEELDNENVNDLSSNIDINETSVIEEEIVEQIEDYSTVVTPNIEEKVNFEQKDEESQLPLELEMEEEPIQINENQYSEEILEDSNAEQINTLFDTEQQIENIPVAKKKKSSAIMTLVTIFAFLICAAYFGYVKILSNKTQNQEPAEIEQIENSENAKNNTDNEAVQPDAMPVESIEADKELSKTNEGTAVAIPAIEQNIDASILVSNLSVNWEVPAGYLSNSTAKRYFTKIGKIIQLNLKLELSLLSKPPITNKIAVELEYNPQKHNFNVKNMIASSGEPTVDKLVQQTIQKALDMNLNMNLSSLGNIQGNPVLIIKL